jgi:hypothetical protein
LPSLSRALTSAPAAMRSRRLSSFSELAALMSGVPRSFGTRFSAEDRSLAQNALRTSHVMLSDCSLPFQRGAEPSPYDLGSLGPRSEAERPWAPRLLHTSWQTPTATNGSEAHMSKHVFLYSILGLSLAGFLLSRTIAPHRSRNPRSTRRRSRARTGSTVLGRFGSGENTKRTRSRLTPVTRVSG